MHIYIYVYIHRDMCYAIYVLTCLVYKKINLQFLLARVLSRDLDRLDYEDAKAAGKGAIHSLFWLLKN